MNADRSVIIDPQLEPIALIPARGGSKGVPGKNLRAVADVPLLARSIRAAHTARSVGAVWVSSDDSSIGDVAQEEGAGWLRRPDSLSGDLTSSEDALAHGLHELLRHGALPSSFVFLQCTSPFTTAEHIDAVLKALKQSSAGMAFSVMPWHGFLWQCDPNGHGFGVNHDAEQPRQRRQDLPPTYLETGAIYAIRTELFLQQKTRFVAPVLPVPIDALAPEIDTEDDLVLCEQLAPLLDRAPLPMASPTQEVG